MHPVLPLFLPTSGKLQKSPPPLVFWIVWFGLTISIPLYQFALGHGLPTGNNSADASLNPIAILAIGQFLAATALRWLVLPRVRMILQVLIVMIIGVTLCEAVELYGIFLIPASEPETKLWLLILSLIGAAQFVPFYAAPAQPAART
jgi:hypothetical protein